MAIHERILFISHCRVITDHKYCTHKIYHDIFGHGTKVSHSWFEKLQFLFFFHFAVRHRSCVCHKPNIQTTTTWIQIHGNQNYYLPTIPNDQPNERKIQNIREKVLICSHPIFD